MKRRDPVVILICAILFLLTIHLNSQPVPFLQKALITLLADLIIASNLVTSNFAKFERQEEQKTQKQDVHP